MRLIISLAVMTILIPGCATLPAPPAGSATPDLPQAWSTASSAVSEPVMPGWLDDFHAPGLDVLVDEALRTNPDLKIMVARVTAAQARAQAAGATRRPNVSLEFTARRGKRAPSGLAASSANLISTFGLDANIAWEVDLWNRLGDEAKASVADVYAVEADYAAARLILAANVARTWSSATEASAQVRLSERTVASFRQVRTVIEERYRAGLTTALDVRFARENVATAESFLAQRRREADALSRALEILLGRYPAAVLTMDISLPRVRKAVPAGLPAEILARRPDLRAGEMRLEAAGSRLSAARKNRLPGIRLTGSTGTASAELSNLLNWDQLVWSLLAGITQPIFSGGRLSAEQTLAEAGHQEAWAAYAQMVLTAFREVETTLSAESFYNIQETALGVASEEAQAAAVLAFEHYGQGLIDIVTLLDAQRRAFTAESDRLRTIRQRLNNRVDLYLALGGDFNSDENNEKVAP